VVLCFLARGPGSELRHGHGSACPPNLLVMGHARWPYEALAKCSKRFPADCERQWTWRATSIGTEREHCKCQNDRMLPQQQRTNGASNRRRGRVMKLYLRARIVCLLFTGLAAFIPANGAFGEWAGGSDFIRTHQAELTTAHQTCTALWSIILLIAFAPKCLSGTRSPPS
jgi:hypothetical protein